MYVGKYDVSYVITMKPQSLTVTCVPTDFNLCHKYENPKPNLRWLHFMFFHVGSNDEFLYLCELATLMQYELRKMGEDMEHK